MGDSLRLRLDWNQRANLDCVSLSVCRALQIQPDVIPMEPVELREKRMWLEQARLESGFAQKRRIEERIKELEVESARSGVAGAETELKLAKTNASQAKVCARQSGFVQGCDPEALRGSFVTEGQPLFKVAGIASWRAIGYANERDIPKLRSGLEARLFVHAYPQEEYQSFAGNIEEVGVSPIGAGADGGSRKPGAVSLYPITIRITDSAFITENGAIALYDGLTAEVEVITKRGRIIVVLMDKLFTTASRVKRARIETGP